MHSNEDIEKDLHGPERRFAITTWAVNNRTTVIVLTILICVRGSTHTCVMTREFSRSGYAGDLNRHAINSSSVVGH